MYKGCHYIAFKLISSKQQAALKDNSQLKIINYLNLTRMTNVILIRKIYLKYSKE